MKLNLLITSDLHLSDRARDRYRFGLFKWLVKKQRKYNVDATFILGDVTDRKDNHSAALVNEIIDNLILLKPPVYILKGNHDFIDPDTPYFRFLSRLDGIKFISEPTLLPDWGWGAAMIPHQPDQASFDQACRIIPPKCTLICLHQALDGALAETGTRLTGLQTSHISVLQGARLVAAGDIHRPQACAGALYVGAPYHVRFGDDFEPRVILYNGQVNDLHYPAPRKRILRIRGTHLGVPLEANSGDHVRITVEINREEVTQWAAIKAEIIAACKAQNLELFGITLEISKASGEDIKNNIKTYHEFIGPEQVFKAFCQHENTPGPMRAAGAEILKA